MKSDSSELKPSSSITKSFVTGDLIRSGVLSIGDGYRAKNSELAQSGIPFARAGNIEGGFHFGDADRFPVGDLDKVGEKISRPGDVVFTSKGTVGRFAFVRDDTPRFVYSPQLCYWRSTNPSILDPRFLYYWMHGREFQLQCLGCKGQTDMADYVSLTDQRRMTIGIPDILEQKRISAILGNLDDKIELNRKTNETLEAIARAIFKSWFIDFDPVRAKMEGRKPEGMDEETVGLFTSIMLETDIGLVPDGWQIGTLSDLVDVQLGGDWGSDQPGEEESIPVFCIRGADISSLQTAGRGKMPIRYLKASSLEKRRLQEDDLVVEISGGSPTQSTGRSLIISNGLLKRLNYPLTCSNFCRLLRLKRSHYSQFVYQWLRWMYARDAFLEFENGTTGIKNLAFSVFSKQYKFALPPDRLISRFTELVSSLSELHQANGAASESLASVRDTLLPKLLSCGTSLVGEELPS